MKVGVNQQNHISSNDVYVHLSYKISNQINKLLSDIIITERENYDIITVR